MYYFIFYLVDPRLTPVNMGLITSGAILLVAAMVTNVIFLVLVIQCKKPEGKVLCMLHDSRNLYAIMLDGLHNCKLMNYILLLKLNILKLVWCHRIECPAPLVTDS
jgi:hypothetical protein